MAAEDHLSGQQFFHGTNAELKPGDVLHPPGQGGAMTFNPPHAVYSPEHVYYSTSQSQAEGFASTAARRRGGAPRVYEVEPEGETEKDPETAGVKGWDVNYRSRSARVKREIGMRE